MKDNYNLIRQIEALVALITTYLSIQSFFSSSIYIFIGRMIKWILEGLGFTLETHLDPSFYMPLVLTGVVFIVIAHEFILGEEKNIINIYQVNFMLFIPEALSYSHLNWFNLVNAGYILQPTRTYNHVLITGVIIMLGYTVLTFTTQHRSNMRQYLEKGADVLQMNVVIEKQTILAFALGIISALIILLISSIITLVKNWFLPYLIKFPYAYLILGLFASTSIIFWVILTIKNVSAKNDTMLQK